MDYEERDLDGIWSEERVRYPGSYWSILASRQQQTKQRQPDDRPLNGPRYHQRILLRREKVLFIKRLVQTGLYETEEKLRITAARIIKSLTSTDL